MSFLPRVEREHLHDLSVASFRDPILVAEGRMSRASLFLLSIRASISPSKVPAGDELVDHDILGLPQPESPVRRHGFSTAGFHHRSKCTTWLARVRFQASRPLSGTRTRKGNIGIPLKGIGPGSVVFPPACAVRTRKSGASENSCQVFGERFRDFGILGEEQHALMLFQNGLANLAKHGEFAAIRFFKAARTRVVIG